MFQCGISGKNYRNEFLPQQVSYLVNYVVGLAVSFTSNIDKGTNKKNPDFRIIATVTGFTMIITVLQT